MFTLELFENDDEFAPSQRVNQQILHDRHPLHEYVTYEDFEQLMDVFNDANNCTASGHEAADAYLGLLSQISNIGFDEIFYNIIEDWIQERYGSNRFNYSSNAASNEALIEDLIIAFRRTWTGTKPHITVYNMVKVMSKVNHQMSDFDELETYDDQMDESDSDLFANKLSVKEQIVRLLNDISNDYYDNAKDADDDDDDDDEIDEMLVISQQVADVSDQFGKDISSGLRAWHAWLDERTREEVRGEILHNLKIDIQGIYDDLPPINENNKDDMFALPRITRTQYLIVSMMKQRLKRGMNPDDAVWQVADELDMDKYDVIGEFPDSLVKELEDTGLWENNDNSDDLFTDRVGSWVKNIQDVVQCSVDGWLDMSHDPVNYRNIEIGYEGVEAVKEFAKGMESGLRAWYQLDDELRDRIAASIKDELEIDFYAMYDSLPVNEEGDDLFAEPTDASDIAEALEWLSRHWRQRAENQGDESWSRDADRLRYAASLFARGGMMPGVNALNEIDRWEVIGDDFEFWHADEWQKLEQYLNNLNEDDEDDINDEELDADEREANLQRFWATSHPDTQKRLYRGQRRAPKPDRFVTTKGRETPSFTHDPEVANVYSRQLDWDVVHGPGSTSVPVYLQMNNPLDIRGLGEYFNLLDFINVLPNLDLSQETIANGVGYYDLYLMLSDLDELVYKTGAKYEIEASGSDSLSTIRDFEELATEILNSGEEGDIEQIEYMLSETQLDSFIIADSPDIVRRLEKIGYDGVILDDIFTAGSPYYQGDAEKLAPGLHDEDDKVITAYRPFDQGKIKSAIGNRGTYNTADPDITREDKL